MTLSSLPAEWHGVGFIPLMVLSIGLGKFAFHQRPLDVFQSTRPLRLHPALPFYVLGYGLSIGMLIMSQSSALTLTTALGLAAVLYIASAALFHKAAWLYPGLLAAHVGLVTYFSIDPTDAPPQYLSLVFMGVTWIMALLGYVMSAIRPVVRATSDGAGTDSRVDHAPILKHLLTPSWSQPFFIFMVLDVLFWQWAALGRYDTAILVAVGFALLLGLFATLWHDRLLAYGAISLFLLAAGYRLHWVGLPMPQFFASFGGLGLGLYLLGRLAEVATTRTRVWINPLTHTSILLTGLAVLATLPTAFSHPVAAASALAFAGVLYLSIAFRGRYQRLGYAAVALLQVAWILLLRFVNAGEPQLFAIPAGLYFLAIGTLERRRGRKRFALIVETFGLAVLLLTTFIQSLYGGNAGLPYFVLLVVEGLAVIAWGAWRHYKVPFFIGLAASALNVAGQVVVLFGGGSTFTRWAVIGTAGLTLVLAAVFVERQRGMIIAKAREWREALEQWE